MLLACKGKETNSLWNIFNCQFDQQQLLKKKFETKAPTSSSSLHTDQALHHDHVSNTVSMKGCTWSATMLMLKETMLDAKDTTVFRNSKDGHWMVQAVHSSIISKPRSLRIRTCPLYTRATSLRCMWAEEKTLSFPVLCSGKGKNCQLEFWCRERLYENAVLRRKGCSSHTGCLQPALSHKLWRNINNLWNTLKTYSHNGNLWRKATESDCRRQ